MHLELVTSSAAQPLACSDMNNGEDKTKSSLKLALNKKLTTALVTHHLSQNEADALFISC